VKAVGMNIALALAGGPVDAAALSLQPLRLFASIQIADSVTDGISYFYAEVKRLRWLLECLRAPDETPLLYLIDEVFRGTNNRERLIGSRELIRSMARERGVGLIATHDLELVTLAEEIATVRNGHFRDDVTDGRMTFDYTLRDGPCPTTNALQIMRLEGLPAPGE
jgi:DNA mismatch repair ATPase MutS